MPNEWARSAINVYLDISMQLSMPNQWARSSTMSLHWHKHLIDQYHKNGHNQLSMSTRTQARNQSTPNQRVQSAINVSSWTQALDLSMPMNGHDQLSMSTWTQVRNYQCQTYGHDLHRTRKQLLSCSNQSWVSISTNVHADRLRFAMQYKPPPYQYRASTMQ